MSGARGRLIFRSSRHAVCIPCPSVAPAISKPQRSLESDVLSLKAEFAALKQVVACCYVCAKGVMARYGWSRRTFYRRRAEKSFPQPKSFPGKVWTLAQLEAAEKAGQLPSPSAGH